MTADGNQNIKGILKNGSPTSSIKTQNKTVTFSRENSYYNLDDSQDSELELNQTYQSDDCKIAANTLKQIIDDFDSSNILSYEQLVDWCQKYGDQLNSILKIDALNDDIECFQRDKLTAAIFLENAQLIFNGEAEEILYVKGELEKSAKGANKNEVKQLFDQKTQNHNPETSWCDRVTGCLSATYNILFGTNSRSGGYTAVR